MAHVRFMAPQKCKMRSTVCNLSGGVRMKKYIFAFILFCWGGALHAQEYEVLPHGGGNPRGVLWISDGPAYISGGSDAVVNRFGFGAGLQLGADYRFTLGLQIIDSFSSGEKSKEVGSVNRSGSGIMFGYALIPDRLCLNYTFHMHTVRGNRVTGSVGATGHQLALNQRIYAKEGFRLSAELSYLVVPDVSVPVLDAATSTVQTAAYPSANIVTLGLVFGFGFN